LVDVLETLRILERQDSFSLESWAFIHNLPK